MRVPYLSHWNSEKSRFGLVRNQFYFQLCCLVTLSAFSSKHIYFVSCIELRCGGWACHSCDRDGNELRICQFPRAHILKSSEPIVVDCFKLASLCYVIFAHWSCNVHSARFSCSGTKFEVPSALYLRSNYD